MRKSTKSLRRIGATVSLERSRRDVDQPRNAIGIVAFLVERSMLLIGSARHVEREECLNVL